MRAAIVCALLLGATLARADTLAPAAVDTRAVQKDLVVATDGRGHYVLFPTLSSRLDYIFYGDGKTFYQQRIIHSFVGGSTGTLEYAFWEPRVLANSQAKLMRDKGKLWIRCRQAKTPLSVVDGAARAKLLAEAKTLGFLWRRQPHLLARDDRGVYYFVDRPRDAPREVRAKSGYEVFVGPAGKMKRQVMKQVVADALGEIFVTRGGRLRLLLSRDGEKSSATWFRGRRQTQLKVLPFDYRYVSTLRTFAFIYTDLGVYAGARLGTPCDDL